MRANRPLAAWLAAIVLAMAAAPAAGLEPARLVAGFRQGFVLLETEGPRCLLIQSYFATTPQQRAQGLMFVESLGEFEGMYFSNSPPAEVRMWMKNTLLPLDMLFVRADGKIGHIAADTRPLSADRISSRAEVVGVLELNAGFARRWRVTPGTRLWLF